MPGTSRPGNRAFGAKTMIKAASNGGLYHCFQMQSNEIISYLEMCSREGLSLQRGMNFNATLNHSVVLSSHRSGAPYDDLLEENGTVLIYEGHDEPRTRNTPSPKQLDQPLRSKNGKLTQNGFFHEAAQAYKRNVRSAARVRVYEKIKAGIWSYNGLFELLDSWTKASGNRMVYKFKLHSIPDQGSHSPSTQDDLEQRRIIPSRVKLAVWKRDNELASNADQKRTCISITSCPIPKGVLPRQKLTFNFYA